MKEKELREAAQCAVCKRKLGETRVPLFYRLRIERHILNVDAINRHIGLTMTLGGNATLAAVMGPDEDMTTQMMDPVTVTVCEECSYSTPLVQIALGEDV